MNVTRLSLFFLLIPLLVPACLGEESRDRGNFPRRIVPLQEGDRTAVGVRGTGDTDTEYGQQRPVISLNYNEHLVQLLTINLDIDAPTEQILIVKETVRDDAPLRIVIADFSVPQNRYQRSWETALAAVNERTVRIDVKDIVGDQSLQIIVSGMNQTGAVTLDVFKQRPSSSYALSYFPICRIESDGSIEIVESERAAGYSGGHRYGASFPIAAYRSNPESEYYSDIIRDTYQYNYGSLRYELVKKETIPTEKVGEAELAALFRSTSPEPFKKFIKGLWHRREDESTNEEKILSFDPETEEIAFYTKGAQEVYKWKYSRRSLYNTLNVYTENNLLKSIQPNITFSLQSVNELNVVITEYSTMEQWLNDQWGGHYVRNKPGAATGAPEQINAAAPDGPPVLAGVYDSPKGMTLTFDRSSVLWKDKTASREGGYAIVEFFKQEAIQYVLSLKLIEDQGLKITDLFFIIETSGPVTHESPLSSFTLKPAVTTVYGIKDLKGQPLFFSRREK